MKEKLKNFQLNIILFIILIFTNFCIAGSIEDIKVKFKDTYRHMKAIVLGLNTFQADYSFFPYAENIKELLNQENLFMRGHYLPEKYYGKTDEVIKDGWGNEMIYQASESKDSINIDGKIQKLSESFKIISKGPDAKLDTADDIIWTNREFKVPEKYLQILHEIKEEEKENPKNDK